MYGGKVTFRFQKLGHFLKNVKNEDILLEFIGKTVEQIIIKTIFKKKKKTK